MPLREFDLRTKKSTRAVAAITHKQKISIIINMKVTKIKEQDIIARIHIEEPAYDYRKA